MMWSRKLKKTQTLRAEEFTLYYVPQRANSFLSSPRLSCLTKIVSMCTLRHLLCLTKGMTVQEHPLIAKQCI